MDGFVIGYHAASPGFHITVYGDISENVMIFQEWSKLVNVKYKYNEQVAQ